MRHGAYVCTTVPIMAKLLLAGGRLIYYGRPYIISKYMCLGYITLYRLTCKFSINNSHHLYPSLPSPLDQPFFLFFLLLPMDLSLLRYSSTYLFIYPSIQGMVQFQRNMVYIYIGCHSKNVACEYICTGIY